MAKEVWGILGQSNGVGQGHDISPIYVNASQIFRYSQYWDATNNIPYDITNLSRGAWGPSSDPLHGEPTSGIGPGNPFADQMITLRADPSLNIGLVPCAVSGTGVTYDWCPVYRYWSAFSAAVARLRAASSWGTLRGVIHYQGELEAQNPPFPWFWTTAVYALHQALKAELNNPNLLMIVVVLGPNPGSAYPSWATIQNYARQMSGTSPLIGIADASDLTAIPGNIAHITAASAVTLGHRIAKTAFDLGHGMGFW